MDTDKGVMEAPWWEKLVKLVIVKLIYKRKSIQEPVCKPQQTGKFLKRWEYQTTLPASWDICMQVKKQQLKLYMEQ